MKYALFIAEEDKVKSVSNKKDWSTFVLYAEQTTGEYKSISRLNEGSFLCKLSGGLGCLSRLVIHADDNHIRSRTLFFDEEPSWVISK